jgi:hypothetical protein
MEIKAMSEFLWVVYNMVTKYIWSNQHFDTSAKSSYQTTPARGHSSSSICATTANSIGVVNSTILACAA